MPGSTRQKDCRVSGHGNRSLSFLGREPERAPSQGASKIDIFTTKQLLEGLLGGYRALRGHTDGSATPRKLSQEHLARLSGMTRPWYRQLEKGDRRGSIVELERIAQVLQMTSRARAALFRRSAGHDPLPFTDSCAPDELHALWRPASEAQPACTVDAAFDIWHHNGRFASRFPHATNANRRPNLVEVLLLRPEPRRQLDSWPHWARLLTAELAEAVALYGQHHPSLLRLHSEVAADERVGPVYRAAAGYLFPDVDCKATLLEASPYAGLRQLTLLGT
ncbi:helix-turn-helix domain-containing protein [Streptomyces lydicus]|uniref:helix-turn-helix domain-containing protein n=1 Tax=Streptomyces lydicus TaxID=47763 RepID=UPI0036ECD751